jgi:hypothetical protein
MHGPGGTPEGVTPALILNEKHRGGDRVSTGPSAFPTYPASFADSVGLTGIVRWNGLRLGPFSEEHYEVCLALDRVFISTSFRAFASVLY